VSSDVPRSTVSEPPRPAARRARLLFAVKLLVTAGALAFTFSRLSFAELAGAVRRLHPGAVLVAAALTLANLALAGVRWRLLLAAYGAKEAPPVAFLARAQLVGHFYNTFVPGNVTGDVLRAHATRRSFEGPLGSYMVVALERFFGLAGLFSLGALGLLLRPLPGVMRADLLAGLAFATAFAIALLPIAGRSIGRRLPGRLGTFAANLPAVARPGLLGVVLALALVAHTIVALTGHVLIDAIAPQVAAHESIVLVPLAMIATYVPFSVAGLGVREAAFVFLFGAVGVRAADATAAALAFLAVYALVAGLGGLVHLFRPLEIEEPAAVTSLTSR
jgi:glycosyltransferase 2 family protein